MKINSFSGNSMQVWGSHNNKKRKPQQESRPKKQFQTLLNKAFSDNTSGIMNEEDNNIIDTYEPSQSIKEGKLK